MTPERALPAEPSGSTALRFQPESFAATAAEAIPLMKREARELGMDRKAWPFRPDLAMAARACDAGQAVWYTAREPEQGRMVGFALFAFWDAMTFQGVRMATAAAFYMAPEHRTRGGLNFNPPGWQFIEYCERQLRAHGVQGLQFAVWRGTRAGRSLEGLGYEPEQIIYSKVLEE
jgi:hypothetical protein